MGACTTPETTIEEYVHKLRRQANRIPLSGTLELTHRCNNRCVHCYVNKPGDDKAEQAAESDTEQICRFLDDMATSGCLWLLITGGEPLLRPDFEDIYVYAKKKGFLITLFTNGTLITPSLADLLAEFPPRFIEITLYGATQETYETMTRSPGAFKKCLDGIHLLLDRSLPLKLKTVITTVNRHEFAAAKDYVESLGLEFRFDALINGRVDGTGKTSGLRVTPREVMELDLSDPGRGPEFVAQHRKLSELEIDYSFIYRCGAGLNSFLIDPHGRLALCSMARFPSYDLKSGTFDQGWREFIFSLRTQKYVSENPCTGCDLISICGQCAGWSQLEYGNPEIPVDYLCEVTRLRAETYGIR